MATHYVIVGAGLAGVEAAQTIRTRDADGQITLIGEEPSPFYTRIRLPELVAGTLPRDKLTVKSEAWYQERRIELRLGVKANHVDVASRAVKLSDGSTVPYDKLLLATGASCFVPPFTGSALPGVVTIRTAEDAARLRELALAGGQAVFVGGGLLGLEMAAAVRTAGVQVTVVEVAPWLLPRQVDREGGALIQAILERKGLSFRVGAQVDAVLGEGKVRAVRLKGAEELPASVVVVSAGVRPNVALARAAGCAVDKGIKVDDTLATTVPGLFAAGDCVEHRARVYGTWAAAEEQARVAGAVMGGGEATYRGTVPSNRLKVTGVDVMSAGDFDPEDKRKSEVTRGPDSYRKLVFGEAGKLVGAVLVGDIRDHRRLQLQITEGAAA